MINKLLPLLLPPLYIFFVIAENDLGIKAKINPTYIIKSILSNSLRIKSFSIPPNIMLMMVHAHLNKDYHNFHKKHYCYE